LNNVKAELGGKLDALTEMYNKGANRQSIGEQITEVKKVADNLGYGTSKVSELKEMWTLFQTMRPSDKNIPEQVKEAKELLSVMQGGGDREARVGVSDGVALQMKKMETDLAIRLEELADARQKGAQEFELRMKQFEIDTQLKKQEIEGQIAVQRERNQMLSDLVEGLGGTVTKGMMDNAGGPLKVASRIIEIGEGEFGEVECPNCKNVISVATDAAKAVCPGCNTVYPIQRIAREAVRSEDG